MAGRRLTQEQQEFAEILSSGLPPMVARKSVEQFLGGVVSTKTLANADAKGEGPEVAYAVGRSIVYRREALVDWLMHNFDVRRLETMKGL